MSSFLQPDPVLLAFIFAKKFVFAQTLVVLALIRVIRARRMARALAVVALLCALAISATAFAPALGWHQNAAYSMAARWMALGGGIYILFLPSSALALSGCVPVPRSRLVDLGLGVWFCALLGLWWWTT